MMGDGTEVQGEGANLYQGVWRGQEVGIIL